MGTDGMSSLSSIPEEVDTEAHDVFADILNGILQLILLLSNK